MVDVDLRVVPCTYSVFNHKDLGILYFAKIYQIIEMDTLVTHSFWRKCDFDDNCLILNELDIPYEINLADVRLSPKKFPSMYNDLMNYLNNVPHTHSD